MKELINEVYDGLIIVTIISLYLTAISMLWQVVNGEARTLEAIALVAAGTGMSLFFVWIKQQNK